MTDERIPPDRLAAEVERIYAEAERRLRLLVEVALRSNRLGTASYRQRQLTAVERVLARLRRDGRLRATSMVEASYRAAQRAVDAVAGMGGSFGGGAHDRAVRVLVDNITNALDQAAVTVGRRTEDAFRRAGLRESAVGLATGSTRKEISAALENRLIEEGVTDAVTGFVDRRGARWPLATYTEMVARTTTREAVSEATVNRMRDHDLDLVGVSSHEHERDECTPYDGRTFSLSGRDRRYKQLDRLPPFHPRCIHVLHPAVTTLDDFEKQLGIKRRR